MSDESKDNKTVTATDLDILGARVGAGIKALGWVVKRDGAKLECGIDDLLLLRVVLQPADAFKPIADLIGAAQADLLKIAKGRALRPPRVVQTPAPEERVVSRNGMDLRAAKNAAAHRAGRAPREDKG